MIILSKKINWYLYLFIIQKVVNDYKFDTKIKLQDNFYRSIINIITLKNYSVYSCFINYQYFNTYYLNSIYKINLKEKHINSLKILPKKILKHILYKTRYKSYKRFNIKYFNEVIFMFLVCIWLKNSKLLCKFIKHKLDNVHFKKHRAYFLFFFKILNLYIVPNFTTLKTKGITIKFKGKLGRGGNSRKKTTFYHKGYYSLSNKFLSLNQHKWNVWTRTGAVGCTLQIFY